MASTSSQTTASAALSSPPARWDVFLSFRGEDTRNKFTSHLYTALDRQGIRTFMDDPELRKGEVIREALLEAIRGSKSYIVVFSENYASSPWCLDELIEILRCKNEMKERLVIPVFFNIDPSVVRHQNGSFKEAFEKHESPFSTQMEKVNKWRLALTEVANISGQYVSKKRSEADIINEIVDGILLKINPKILNVAKYPVGLNFCVKDITGLLSTNTEGVIKLGIYGMGGVGKTTLAKALYNQLLLGRFQGSCFLSDCREVSGRKNGLKSLQEQLINDVLRSEIKVGNIDNGIHLIKERICSKKLLVVIDDLDNPEPLDCLVGQFAPGSIVIITTRLEDLLEKIDVEPRYRYKVNELNKDMSRTLFTKHAFGNGNPERSRTLMVLAEEILHHAKGLPLALKVFGSSLYNKPEAGWKYFINRLQQNPDSTIQQRLMISLDGLSDDPTLKKLFLDIACFLNGSVKNRAVKLLETYYSDADYKIGILKQRCLLDIDDSNKLRMHDLLRDMGREVSRNNPPNDPSRNDPGKYSRLWEVEDICDVLMRQKGTEVIEGIIPWNQKSMEGISFTAKTFERLSNLRFLFLNDVNITGTFNQSPEDLRWLSWYECPLESFPSEVYLRKLVFLALPASKLRTMKLNMVFKNLKNLDMSGSRHLTTLPDFIKLPCLKTLNLSYCRSLEQVYISNGTLEKLVYLNLEGCVKLKCLPNTLGNLGALKILNINFCTGLKELPENLGNIKSLRKLRASNLGLHVLKLPESIGRLCRLVELFLSGNHKLETLPDSICNLRALEVLDISHCSNLKALPVELGKMESLKELSMIHLTVSEIPNSIGNLHQLAILELKDWYNLRNLPDTICNLRALEVLDITHCRSLRALPVELGKMESLKKLYMVGMTGLTEIPNSIGNLHQLAILELIDCENLKNLPDTICTLRALEVLDISWCRSLRALPVELGKMESLKRLHLAGLTVSEIPNSIGNLHQLAILNLAYCENLRNLPDCIGSLRSRNLVYEEEHQKNQGNLDSTELEYLFYMDQAYLKTPSTYGRTNYERTPVSDAESEWDLFGNLA